MSKDSKKSEGNMVSEYEQGDSIAVLAERYGLTEQEVTDRVVQPVKEHTSKTEG